MLQRVPLFALRVVVLRCIDVSVSTLCDCQHVISIQHGETREYKKEDNDNGQRRTSDTEEIGRTSTVRVAPLVPTTCLKSLRASQHNTKSSRTKAQSARALPPSKQAHLVARAEWTDLEACAASTATFARPVIWCDRKGGWRVAVAVSTGYGQPGPGRIAEFGVGVCHWLTVAGTGLGEFARPPGGARAPLQTSLYPLRSGRCFVPGVEVPGGAPSHAAHRIPLYQLASGFGTGLEGRSESQTLGDPFSGSQQGPPDGGVHPLAISSQQGQLNDLALKDSARPAAHSARRCAKYRCRPSSPSRGASVARAPVLPARRGGRS